MHSTTIINILLLASGALAFTIPAAQPNGVYSVYIADDGTEVHELVTAASDVDPASIKGYASGISHAKDRRQVPGVSNTVGCGGYELDHADADAAAWALDAQCGGGTDVGVSRDFYSLSNCVVSYFCNLAGQDNTCFSSQRILAFNVIATSCGSYFAGWDLINNSQINDQYGQEDNCGAGRNFCGRGTGGKRSVE